MIKLYQEQGQGHWRKSDEIPIATAKASFHSLESEMASEYGAKGQPTGLEYGNPSLSPESSAFNEYNG